QDWLNNNGGSAVASDLCSSVTWTNNFSALSDDCGETGSATVIFTATDECGNSAETSATFTIEDTLPPMITNPAENNSVTCDGSGNTTDLQNWLANNGGTTASDNCSNVTWTNNFSALSDDCGETGSATVIFTATDECGNEISSTAIFTIEDNSGPTIETPAADLMVECDGSGNTTDLQDWLDNNGGAIASDLCSNVTWTNNFSALSDDCGMTGSASVTFTATDECGNMTDTTAIFTIEDTTPPSLTPGSDFQDQLFVTCDVIPSIPDLGFEDACSQMTVVAPDPDNEVIINIDADNYQIIRTWTVTDECMNMSQFIQTINVAVESQVQGTDTELCILDDFEFDLFDLLSGNFDTDGVWTVTAGDVTIDGSFFNPSSILDINDQFTEADLGDYMFTYTVGGICPSITDVIITINDECVVLPCGLEDVIISKAVTPSTLDGVNDVFSVSGIEDCGFVIELQIFNRWGAKIYDNSNYQNDWNGQASRGSVGNSGYVPTGTYYYIIKLKGSTGDLELKPITGPIYVSTN
ncbi:gliding motility-associated C-terminal domain-containing protein, partial [Psychroserpens sp.]|uniref:gliding motility-associated C-terminal domain-containing protein n=1 Tax=Psychroserpens sp. TaxID=2020870 RepID=UPI0038585A75